MRSSTIDARAGHGLDEGLEVAGRGSGAEGRSLTLGAVVEVAWAGLRADAPVACVVCDGRMEPRWSAGSGVVGGRCGDCGSELS